MFQAHSPASKILDYQAALGRVGGDLELLREIAELFQQECPRVMRDLREALSRGDLAAAGRAAHSLKGSAANFEAVQLVDAALKIERLTHGGRIEEAAAAYDVLDRAVGSLLSELREV